MAHLKSTKWNFRLNSPICSFFAIPAAERLPLSRSCAVYFRRVIKDNCIDKMVLGSKVRKAHQIMQIQSASQHLQRLSWGQFWPQNQNSISPSCLHVMKFSSIVFLLVPGCLVRCQYWEVSSHCFEIAAAAALHTHFLSFDLKVGKSFLPSSKIYGVLLRNNTLVSLTTQHCKSTAALSQVREQHFLLSSLCKTYKFIHSRIYVWNFKVARANEILYTLLSCATQYWDVQWSRRERTNISCIDEHAPQRKCVNCTLLP